MNGVKGGFDIKWVAANFSPDPKSKSGLWVRLKEGESASRVAMAGRRLGTMIGKGSVIAYPVEKALEQHGRGLADIQYQQLGSADVLTALQNGGVDSAWLLDPVRRKVGPPTGLRLPRRPTPGRTPRRHAVRPHAAPGRHRRRRHTPLPAGCDLRHIPVETPEVRRIHPPVHPIPPHGLGNTLRHDDPTRLQSDTRPRVWRREPPTGVTDGEPNPVRGGGGPRPLSVKAPGAGTLTDSGPRPSVAGTGFEPATSGL